MKKIAADRNYKELRKMAMPTRSLFPEGKRNLIDAIAKGIAKKERILARYINETPSPKSSEWREGLYNILSDILSRISCLIYYIL